MPTLREIKAGMRLIKGGLGVETKAAEALKTYEGFEAVNQGVVAAQSHLPVRVRHPLNPKEVFQFPVGTSEKDAKDMVRAIIKKRVVEGEEKITLPSQAPQPIYDEIERLQSKINRVADTDAELAKRPGLQNMGPQLYYDEATGKYWKVNDRGHIEELTMTGNIDEGFEKWSANMEHELRHDELGQAMRAAGPPTKTETTEGVIQTMRAAGLTYDEALKMLNQVFGKE